MADKPLEEFLQSIKAKSKDTIDTESLEWFLNQVEKLSRLTRIRLEEVAQGGETVRQAIITPPTEKQGTGPEDISVGSSAVQIPSSMIMGQQTTNMNPLNIGQLIMFEYDPKWKERLPYYDTFPLVIPVTYINANRFHGLNLHYLPILERAQLMTLLMNVKNTDAITETTRFQVTYDLLNATSSYGSFRACFKEYLTDHVRSPLMIINMTEWERALILPTAQFQKASQFVVWRDSIKKTYG